MKEIIVAVWNRLSSDQKKAIVLFGALGVLFAGVIAYALLFADDLPPPGRATPAAPAPVPQPAPEPNTPDGESAVDMSVLLGVGVEGMRAIQKIAGRWEAKPKAIGGMALKAAELCGSDTPATRLAALKFVAAVELPDGGEGLMPIEEAFVTYRLMGCPK